MATKGRRLTYLIISLGLLVLVVAVYAFRGPILEQWYLSKLDSENEEEIQQTVVIEIREQ